MGSQIETFIVLIIVYTTLALCSASNNIDNSDSKKLERNRRDLSDYDKIAPEEEKRQREFIGKRSREFVGKRSDGGSFELEDDFADSDFQKRMRGFLGKREFVGEDSYDLDDMEKRQREFVGKRSSAFDGYDDNDVFDSYDKRMRGFIGKRFDDASYLVKRLREFVGKRFTPEDIFRMRRRHRLFTQTPVYERELVGKRSFPIDSSEFEEDKRMRDFVGKRMRDFVGKRTRGFIGK